MQTALARRERDPLVGLTLGTYLILEPTAQGGMGTVYRARCTRTGRDCAFKIAGADRGSRHNDTLAREATCAAAVDHPGVVRILDRGVHAGRAYVVMEWLEGETLEARLRRQGRLPIDEALRLGAELCDAVAAIHAAGLIHRDLKPANLILDGHGLRVIDFGLARRADDLDASAHTLCGTLAYVPPERIRGVPADPRTDVYAVGAVIYEMLSGQRAFPERVTARILGGPLDHGPPAMPDGVPPSTRVLVRSMLSVDRKTRPANAAELARRLRAQLQILPPPDAAQGRWPAALVLTSLTLFVLGFAWPL